ncbi:hypothetical protein BRADO3889 [Bradyrhizobium sp. ORS 278]|nr:hypothetical protein BRADO3889 [Bradyrhizobium sp. ORS 278]
MPRFCDCFLNLDGTEIIIYTRTGGGSRSDFVQENRQLRALSGFKRDDDDEFDQSYAIFRYDVPEQIKSMAVELASQGYGVAPSARWKDAAEKWATAKARSDG